MSIAKNRIRVIRLKNQFDRFDGLIQQYAHPVTIEACFGYLLVLFGRYLTVLTAPRRLFWHQCAWGMDHGGKNIALSPW